MTSCGTGEVAGIQIAARGVRPPEAIPTLGTGLGWRDVLGGWCVRWSIGRMRYRVDPGLYRIGRPDAKSEVLVTANYKLTVDKLRSCLGGIDAWLLVLDTRGVNVWCAAGKGTFGTQDLVNRIAATGLKRIVEHRRLIVPQLGAVGVAAHDVKRASGFSVRYGPVLARDLPAYLAAGLKATPAMRRVPFGWRERVVLAPLELVAAWKNALIILLCLVALQLLARRQVTPHVIAEFLPFLGAVLTGGVLVPLLLPWLPSRAFALKGAIAGAVWAGACALLIPTGLVEAAGTTLLILAISSFMALAFTGATTFTTLAGARLEVERAMPAIRIAAASGALLRIGAAFL